jgi:predicted MFS family arabinose efflux permease
MAVAQLPRDALLNWGWRVPFLVSALIILIAFYIRTKVEESAAFEAALADGKPERVPLLAVLKNAKGAAATVFLSANAESAIFYFTAIFGLSYGVQTLHLDRTLLLCGVIVANLFGILGNTIFGALADRFGRKPVLYAAYTLSATYVLFLFFPLLRSGIAPLIVLGMAIPGAVLQPMSLGVNGSFYPELFRDARLRFTGVSLGKQLGTIAGGGLMPAISVTILVMSRGDLNYVLAYFAAGCVAAIAAVALSHETRDLRI